MGAVVVRSIDQVRAEGNGGTEATEVAEAKETKETKDPTRGIG